MNFLHFITPLNKIKFGNHSNDTASIFATPVTGFQVGPYFPNFPYFFYSSLNIPY
jgi:hypothetical protein